MCVCVCVCVCVWIYIYISNANRLIYVDSKSSFCIPYFIVSGIYLFNSLIKNRFDNRINKHIWVILL